MLVMGFHLVSTFGETAPQLLKKLSVIGQTGVDLFFVLSGFLITGILLRTKGEPDYVRSFYVRRALRIFPLYFGFLTLHFFVIPGFLGESIAPFHTQVWSWVMMENVPQTFSSLPTSGPQHYWSLAVEEHFYLVWPWLVLWLSPARLARTVVGIIVLSPLIRFLMAQEGLGIYFFTLTRLDAISMGAGLALLLHERDPSERIVVGVRSILVLLPTVLIPTFLLLSGSGAAWLQAMKHSLILAFYARFVFAVLRDGRFVHVRRLLSGKVVCWFGMISYGLYVFHPAVYRVAQTFLAAQPVELQVVCAVATSVLVAWLSYRFFEIHFLRAKKRVSFASRVVVQTP